MWYVLGNILLPVDRPTNDLDLHLALFYLGRGSRYKESTSCKQGE